MRNQLLFALFFCSTFFCFAQIVEIPDAFFKNALVNYDCVDTDNDGYADANVDLNNDGEIQVSEAEVVLILHVSTYNISSLEGIQSFVNLQTLSCANNEIINLPIDNLVELKEVYCSGNNLTSINANNLINLEILNCEDNEITTLLVNEATSLINLDCADNQISNLEVDQLVNLTTLNSYDNNLISLDVSDLTSLVYLYTSNNDLTSINTEGAINIEYFNISINQLTSVSTSHLPNLYFFGCTQNPLTTLSFEASNSSIVQLFCDNSSLQSLDVSNLPNLEYLSVGYNNLTTIDLSNQSHLIELNVRDNLLEQVFIKNGVDNSELRTYNDLFSFINNPTLEYFCIDESEREYLENRLSSSGLEHVVINTYCSFTPGGRHYTVYGETKIDINTNGCDNLDLGFSNMQFNISDDLGDLGIITSNNLGEHNLPFTEGNYTITPIIENQNYFTISPQNLQVTFEEDSNILDIEQDFCLTPNGTYSDLEVFIVPMTVAVPGFDSEYKIVYKNKGNTTLSGAINFGFQDEFMDFISASPSEDVQNVDNLQWNYSNLQPFESREINLGFSLNTPTEINYPLNSNDILSFEVNIDPYLTDNLQADNSFGLKQTVVNSFDPNDKRCLQGNVIAPELVGEFVHYMIRFENLGTANAINVVVKDTIDTDKFDVSTLVPLSSSHDFQTTIKDGNVVEFIFENIQLSFDDATNDGFIVFKIKTLNTLQLGDTFENDADIFFDYNAPIITNNYITTVQNNLGLEDFELVDASLYPNPTTHSITISSQSNIKQINISGVNGRLINSITINKQNIENIIDVSSLKAGLYFIEVQSDTNSNTLKFIKQ